MDINPPTSLLVFKLFNSPFEGEITPLYVQGGQECVEIVTGGIVLFEEDGREQPFGRGTIFWHVKGDHTVCKSAPGQPFHTVAIWFSVEEDRRTVPHWTSWVEGDEALDALVEDIISAFHDENTDQRLLCDYVHRRILWNAYASSKKQPRSAYPKTLQRAMDFCKDRKHFTSGIREIASAAGVSESHLHELFLKHLNISPHEYLLDSRMRFARLYLADSNETIKTISQMCGFGYLESFYRAFKKQVGMTPAEYRRQTHFIEPNFPIYTSSQSKTDSTVFQILRFRKTELPKIIK